MNATQRTDIHSPANFDPARYAYVGSIDHGGSDPIEQPPWADREATAALDEHGIDGHYAERIGCDHCGAHNLRYVTVYQHENGDAVAVGHQCAANAFGNDTRRDYDIRRLRKQAKDRAERAKAARHAVQWLERVRPFQPTNADLLDWFFPIGDGDTKPEHCHSIISDMAAKLVRYGSLSHKQLAFARLLVTERRERDANGGKTKRELAAEAKRATAEDAPSGRVQVTGTVISTKVQENDYGTQYKMLVEDDRGWRVWISVPSSLQLFDVLDGEVIEPTDDRYMTTCTQQTGLDDGDRIAFKATLTPSNDDAKFCFGKRPGGAKILQLNQKDQA